MSIRRKVQQLSGNILGALRAAPTLDTTHPPLVKGTSDDADVLPSASVALTMTGNACTPDFADGNFFEVTLTGADTLNNPSNPTVNQTGRIVIRQPVAGSCTLAFGTYYKFVGGVDPGVAGGASAVNTLWFAVISATEIECSLNAGLA